MEVEVGAVGFVVAGGGGYVSGTMLVAVPVIAAAGAAAWGDFLGSYGLVYCDGLRWVLLSVPLGSGGGSAESE